MGHRILWVTDFPATGSGYATISQPICNGLVDLGNEVKMLAISNKGEEHFNKFGVIPIDNMQELHAGIHNMVVVWKPEVIIVAMDIPMHDNLINKVRSDDVSKDIPYIGITPMENGPLSPSWAAVMMKLNKIFFISELGKSEAIKAGVSTAEHLNVGISGIWYPPRDGEREIVRKTMGFEENELVILTVADNQERKNFDQSFEVVAKLKANHPELSIKYVLVTKEHSPYGWKPMELSYQYGLHNETIIFERGMPEDRLRLLYISADAFLLTSKAEGLGLPVMEALACGVNCVATNTGALTELLSNDAGWLIPTVFTIQHDVWGHSKRHFIDTDAGAVLLYKAATSTVKKYKKFPTNIMIDQINNSVINILEK